MKLKEKLTRGLEHNKALRTLELCLLAALLLLTLTLAIVGAYHVNRDAGDYHALTPALLTRESSADEEGYDEDYKVCTVRYILADSNVYCDIDYSYREWSELPEEHTVLCHLYEFEDGSIVAFDYEAHEPAIRDAMKDLYAEDAAPIFNAAIAIGILTVSLAVVTLFAAHFTTYEKIWFLSIMVLACIFAIVMPEEEANGVSGIWIMLLYLADTFLNILCELLISKQSKWNFIVSVLVEITEIIICIVLMYRFATMLTTLFFWLPIDILSFINWNRHPDSDEKELTRVRRLRGWQEILVLAGIALWTFGVGFFLSGLDIQTDLFGGNEVLANVVCYLDACASAVGIANGLFIFFRFREQWIAWYLCAILEAVINIMAEQYILLVLKLGYLTNTTYGYLKWTKYIRTHAKDEETKVQKEFF